MPRAKSAETVALTSDLFDAKLLRLFELLHHTGSVTRAAEELGLSQPTVSIWLAKLRTQFNDPLFVRTAEGMQPTPRADSLIGIVQNALEAFRLLSASEPVFNPSTANRSFRICMTDASHITLLPQLLTHGPVSPGRSRHIFLSANLSQHHVRHPQFFGDMGHGFGPDQVIQLLARQRDTHTDLLPGENTAHSCS